MLLVLIHLTKMETFRCHLYLTLNSIKVNYELIGVVITATIARVMNYLGGISKL